MSSFKLRVLIDTTDNNDVFRDILIAGSDNFESLYTTIVSAFEFAGDQLGSFYLSNNDWDKGHEITIMDMGTGKGDEVPSLMRETQIDSLITKEHQKIILVYDFLKMWCFLIEVIEMNDEIIDRPEIKLAIGDPPKEESKEVNFNTSMPSDNSGLELGNDIDDIFSEFDDDDFDDIDSLGDHY